MAVHLYTASRVTTDVDAEFAGRVLLPQDVLVDVVLEDGTPQVIYLDTNYNPTFALMHEDYQEDSIPVDLGLDQIQVRVLSPWISLSAKSRGSPITIAKTFARSLQLD
ncbi:hypothetical protein [Cupriavidus sp. D39]|uniref:hypothetical protein n=1 Tax=Cupriavidus sp. D39 TaxID=2997877 RepID=UPI002270F93B|nr:hypothetical protein [Cupriavidus sp. D39]MCY0852690.1 hypothetical protein [Cupriavidus sp. D39]